MAEKASSLDVPLLTSSLLTYSWKFLESPAPERPPVAASRRVWPEQCGRGEKRFRYSFAHGQFLGRLAGTLEEGGRY